MLILSPSVGQLGPFRKLDDLITNRPAPLSPIDRDDVCLNGLFDCRACGHACSFKVVGVCLTTLNVCSDCARS